MANNKNINTFLSKDLLTFCGIFTGLITLVLAIKVLTSEYNFFISFAFLPLLSGLFFEQKRLGYIWKEIFVKSFAAYSIVCIILLISLQNQSADYYEEDTTVLLSIFIICFVFISIMFAYHLGENSKITAQISEGVLLLQSISLIYFFLDIGFLDEISTLPIIFLVLLIALFSLVVFHSFSSKFMNEYIKLALSICCTMISLIFSILYFPIILQLGHTELTFFQDYLLAFVQYFLFGISIIYTFENIWLLIRFLPDKSESGENYKFRVKSLKREHIDRFSDDQLAVSTSIFSILFLGGIYFINYKMNWLPSLSLIWLIFTFFPFLIYFWEKFIFKNKKQAIS